MSGQVDITSILAALAAQQPITASSMPVTGMESPSHLSTSSRTLSGPGSISTGFNGGNGTLNISPQVISQLLSQTSTQQSLSPGNISALTGQISQLSQSLAINEQSSTSGLPGVFPANNGIALTCSNNYVDLSGIKPISSGSVSISDVVSKGKNSTSKLSSSVYNSEKSCDERSRSYYRTGDGRSRSPDRRSRESYNAYKDEKRRGGSVRRDRSKSPRGARAYSPSRKDVSEYSPSHDYEAISVDSNHVGPIIGRQGENLRKVERETGARIQFLPSTDYSGSQRLCKIFGSGRQRAEARREIFRLIEENSNNFSIKDFASRNISRFLRRDPTREVDGAERIVVPDRTVGLIIGRKGETIRDLQDKSGCLVNIVSEDLSVNGLRPVNLIGSKRSQEIAKDLIMQIVETDTRNSSTSSSSSLSATNVATIPVGSSGSLPLITCANPKPGEDYLVGISSGEDDKYTESILIPCDSVGMIIGRGGDSIKELQNSTNCKIKVCHTTIKDGLDEQRNVNLTGSKLAIMNAKSAILEKVELSRDKLLDRNRTSRSLTLVNDYYPTSMSSSNPSSTQTYDNACTPVSSSLSLPTMPSSMSAATTLCSLPTAMNNDEMYPYSSYGDYWNYVAAWSSAYQQQQQQQQQQQF